MNFNPFASIGYAGLSNAKVKVMVMSKYLIYVLIYQFFHSYMKESSESSPKKRSPDIYLQDINQATYKFSKKKLFPSAKNRAGAERVNPFSTKLIFGGGGGRGGGGGGGLAFMNCYSEESFYAREISLEMLFQPNE